MFIPKLDSRTIEDIYRQLDRMIPYYTPEWRFNLKNPDPGTALFVLFAEMFQETIDRLNKVPLKNYLAFLNMLDIELRSVVPAVGFAQFATGAGTAGKVYIPAKSKLFADRDSGQAERIIFETQQNFFATPAKIKAIFNIDPVRDVISAGYAAEEPERQVRQRICLFDTRSGDNLQEHAFFISENSILHVHNPCIIAIKPINSKNPHFTDNYVQKLTDPELVEWSYHTEDGWKAFDRVEAGEGSLLLYKDRAGVLTSHISEAGPVYIACRTRNITRMKEIATDRVLLASRWNERVGAGAEPELVYADDLPVDHANRYCFGERFSQYNCLYIKSDEVFTKKGAEITLAMEMDFVEKNFQIELPELEDNIKLRYVMDKRLFKKPETKYIGIQRVLPEYWNGNGWIRLEAGLFPSDLFSGEKGMKYFQFRCPEDIASVLVNAVEGIWIRFRIIDIENNFYSSGIYRSPFLKQLLLRYDYKDSYRHADLLVTKNNSVQSPPIPMKKGTEAPVKLFYPLPDLRRAVYICFDMKPEGIPLNLYFQIVSQAEAKVQEPVWYAFSKTRGMEDWEELRTDDPTDGFARSGNVSVESGTDMVPAEFFGISGYWYKIERKDYFDAKLPVIDGIYLNTVEIVQKETHEEERFTLTAEQMDHSIALTYSPVIDEAVWVNEKGQISAEEYAQLLNFQPESVREVKDPDGELLELWIRWTAADHFYDSSKADRHYRIDRFKGVIYFGDGNHGRSVPERGTENILVNYSSGGGTCGNLPEGAVKNLLNSIAYIDGVKNIKPTCGGCDRQDLREAASLGPAVLRNRGRAVTVQDYEKLIRFHFNDARKVKCVPNIDPAGMLNYGAVTVVVMCADFRNVHYNIDLCSDIRDFILKRADCTIAGREKIFVIPPQLLEINVECEAVVEDMELAGPIEKALRDTISGYLDPLEGDGGKGWGVGQMPRPAHFYSSIKKIPGIRYIKRINLDGNMDVRGEKKYFALDKPVNIPFGVPVSGTHKIRLKTE